MRQLQDEINCTSTLENMNVEDSWKSFTQLLQYIVEQCIPKQQKICNQRKQLYTNGMVIKLKHQKEALCRKHCATGDCLDYRRYTVTNSLISITRSLKMKKSSCRGQKQSQKVLEVCNFKN